MLGLELTDSGFDFSVLCEFRGRLIEGKAEERLLSTLLDYAKKEGLIKSRGRQRTDSTNVLSAVRELNRLEMVAETLRAALNELAVVEPEWLQKLVPAEWYKRYGRRIEDTRLPNTAPKREAYAKIVGEDGFFLMDQIDASDFSEELNALSQVKALRIAWTRHYNSDTPSDPSDDGSTVIFKTNAEVKKSSIKIESPYDIDARYRTKRDLSWTGYMVHLSETCDEESLHLITHVHTTPADVHDVKATKIVQEALVHKGLAPKEHLVDSAYVDPMLLVSSKQDYDIDLVGPPRENTSWQTKLEGGYDSEKFTVDWEKQHAVCPQGKQSSSWKQETLPGGQNIIGVVFSSLDCRPCEHRNLCTRAKVPRRTLKFPTKQEYKARKEAIARLDTKEGKNLYGKRAGVEGTISEGVRSGGLRQARYKGLAKTHLQQIASAAAMNFDRFVDWVNDVPHSKTRVSRFTKIQPLPIAV